MICRWGATHDGERGHMLNDVSSAVSVLESASED